VIGDTIRNLRKERDLTLKQMARRTKLSVSLLSQIERAESSASVSSLFKVATALAGAFGCGVNDLPLSMILSWYEQKAVAVLLTLLHLGIRKIRLGPSLPAFLTPALLEVLNKTFELQAIGGVEQDLAAMLGKV